MRFDPAKGWPHPVLRPRRFGDDYPFAEFEVEIDVQRGEGSTAVEVVADFELSDPSLLALVGHGRAQFVLLVRAPTTHYRGALRSLEPRIRESFSAGELSGRVEFLPYLCCTQGLSSFVADGWHEDHLGRTFDIPAGAVLAQDEPKDYWIDTADEMPLGSIFGLRTGSQLKDGIWDCELAEDRVWIMMSEVDTARYEAARSSVDGSQEAQYLMNGLYLPVLIWVLIQLDKDADEYREYRWFSSLSDRLDAVGCEPIGSKSATRLADAQRVLGMPFLKMPVMAEQVRGQ